MLHFSECCADRWMRDEPEKDVVCGGLLQVSIYLQNWPHVTTYVSKAETTPYLMEVI